MNHLIINDLVKSETLDQQAMSLTKGGFFGFGPVAAINAPVFAPVTVITEVSPQINLNLDIANLIGTGFSGVSQ